MWGLICEQMQIFTGWWLWFPCPSEGSFGSVKEYTGWQANYRVIISKRNRVMQATRQMAGLTQFKDNPVVRLSVPAIRFHEFSITPTPPRIAGTKQNICMWECRKLRNGELYYICFSSLINNSTEPSPSWEIASRKSTQVFPKTNGNRNFVTVFIRARHGSLYCDRLI
jgi:hypothetical protein